MTIKILQPGVPKKDRTYFGACGSCGCKFEFQSADARPSPDPRDFNVVVVDCPQSGCNQNVYVQI